MPAPSLAAPPQGVPDASLRRHILRTLRLAGPVILSRVGTVSMLTIDVIVLGRAGADALADYVLGQSVVDSLIAVLAGLLLGVPVLVARQTGRGVDADVGQIWWRGLIYGGLVGLALCLVLQFAEPLFLLTGQTAEMAARGAAVTTLMAWAMPFIALYLVSLLFLEALHRPGIGVIAVVLANLCNLGLNIVLVFGWGPIPAMGAQGCALATVITAALLALGTGLYVRFVLPDRRRYGIDRANRGLWSAAGEQRHIGYAAGMSYGLEATSFAVMTLVVGTLGTLALASYGVLFQFLALPFMVSFGIATATQVRVSNAWGRTDPVGMRFAGWTGLLLSILFSIAMTAVFLAAPDTLIGLFTDDAAVAAAAAPIMIWVALALICDGGQSVVNNACRGRGDTWIPTVLHFASYWLLMVPLAILLAYGFGQGVAGVYQGIALSSVFSLAVLSARFAWISRRRRPIA